jgi:hypothetical protein
MPHDFRTELQARLEELKEQGHLAVDLHSLEGYLASREDQSPSHPTQELEAAHAHAWDLSLMDTAFRAGEATLNAATLINGGAAVALLAFLGNLPSKSPPFMALSVSGLSYAMLWFTVGVLAAGLGHLARYLTAFFGKLQWSAAAGFSNLALIICSLVALFAFAAGGYQAFASIR